MRAFKSRFVLITGFIPPDWLSSKRLWSSLHGPNETSFSDCLKRRHGKSGCLRLPPPFLHSRPSPFHSFLPSYRPTSTSVPSLVLYPIPLFFSLLSLISPISVYLRHSRLSFSFHYFQAQQDAQAITDCFAQAAARLGLAVSIKKTDVIKQARPGGLASSGSITINGAPVKSRG